MRFCVNLPQKAACGFENVRICFCGDAACRMQHRICDASAPGLKAKLPQLCLSLLKCRFSNSWRGIKNICKRLFFSVLQVDEKRSDVVWIMSDIIFSMSYVVFPTSDIIFGMSEERQLWRCMFGRISFAGVPIAIPPAKETRYTKAIFAVEQPPFTLYIME